MIAAPLLAAPLLASLSLSTVATQDDSMGWTGVLDEESFAALHELRDGEAPELAGAEIDLGEGRAYLSLPAHGEPLGAVVVVHEWWGLNDHVKHWADRLAGDGYAALAVDLYGGVVATTRDEAMAAMRGVDEAEAIATLRAAHELLEEHPDIEAERTACIGWCFGGGWSLRLAMAEPELDAAVIYYGRLVTDVEALGGIEAKVLGIFGEQDEGIPPSAVAEFETAAEKADVDLELRSYDAEHAFANPSSARYDAEHAAAAWGETRAFLCGNLFPEAPAGQLSGGDRELEVEYVPHSWTEDGPRTMRLASYSFGAGGECYVAVLRGTGGGVEANLNRWRAQLGEDALDDDGIAALPRIPMLGRLATSMRAEGTYEARDKEPIVNAVLYGAICELEDEAVFVKLIAPAADAESAAEHFAAFCRGLR